MAESEVGTMTVFIGQRKNLRGAQRRVSNICQTPRGFHYYDGRHWTLMAAPDTIVTKEIYAKEQKLTE